jgi:hypothetical protein
MSVSYDGRGRKFPIVIARGTDVAFALTVTDAAGAPVDMSSATVAATVFTKAGASVVSFTSAVSGAGSNVVTLSLTDTQTAALTATGYQWSLLVTRGGDTRAWFAGGVTVVDSDNGGGSTSGNRPVTVDSELNVNVAVAVVGGSGGGDTSVSTDELFDAKGDLAVGIGPNAASKLTVGTNGYVLKADSSEATGVKWGELIPGVANIHSVRSTVTTGLSSTDEETAYSYEIPAGQAQAGDLYVLKLSGDMRQASGASATVITRVKLGATTVLDTGVLTVTNGPSGRRQWHMEVHVAFESGTAQRVSGVCTVGSPTLAVTASAASAGQPSWVGNNTSAEDTSTAKMLAVTLQWSASSANIEHRTFFADLKRFSNF